MTALLSKGSYAASIAETANDIRDAQALRGQVFRAGSSSDMDAYDAQCQHVIVRAHACGTLVGYFRMLPLASGAEINRSYAAQFYNLTGLSAYPGRMVEMGRFCVHPDWHDPDILRIAWGAMTAYVDRFGVEMLFGCSSFPGTEGSRFAEAFALLNDHYLAPRRWLPRVKASSVFPFMQMARSKPNLKRAKALMPPLLRTYLAMGGWVSDHAVVDRDLGTLHVFTGVEIAKIPPARKKLLRAVVG